MLSRSIAVAVTTALVVAALALASWMAFSWLSGATLVIFRTGSMAPTMPQGALAVTVPIFAHELRRGDVVTVQRAHQPLPVTHRVIEVGPVSDPTEIDERVLATAPGSALPRPGAAGVRMLVLQGDANAAPDRMPYVVAEARKTIASVPYLGTALTVLQTPIGMGALLLGAGALVCWALWPNGAGPPHSRQSGVRRAGHEIIGTRS